ncbi:hypothetical protein JD844_027709 [Phrynosoma platyrhinos]|uniref:Uncharacterized protein n=1 Tax=Phrynosoma platyrhinos TaxID=52577 RepID=A0ABQ7SGP7_PHRPL|nr:hypothetical protein JD844_027709 [Phrynosoma platyrhinos]
MAAGTRLPHFRVAASLPGKLGPAPSRWRGGSGTACHVVLRLPSLEGPRGLLEDFSDNKMRENEHHNQDMADCL